MKNKRAIVGLLVVTALAPSCLGGGKAPSKLVPMPIPRWQTQQRVPTGSDLRAVSFASFAVGLIAGKDGAIFRTNNGGFSWIQEDFTPPNRTGDIAALAGLNSRVVAVGADAGGAKEWTSNDSLSFTTADAPGSGQPYTDVALGATGIGPGNPVEIYRLRKDGQIDITALNGGNSTATGGTWTSANGIVNVLSVSIAYIVGDNGGAGQIILFQGGATTCTIPANMKTFRRVVLSTNSRPFACGEDTSGTPKGVVVTVADPSDPTTWMEVPKPGGLTPPGFNAISAPDTRYTYVVGNNGAVYRIFFDSSNSTWTWTDLNPGGLLTTENLYGIFFMDQDRGWIVGDKGTVLLTGSATASTGPWLTKVSGGEAGIAWNALSFSDDGQRGIAVGNLTTGGNARIYRTTNGGSSWSPMALPGTLTNQTLYGVSVPRGNGFGTTAYICGAGGRVYRNQNVWTTGVWDNAGMTGLNGAHTYRAVLFPQAGDKGVLVGDGGGPVLLRTADGLAWAAPTTNTATAPSTSYNALSSNAAGTAVYASGGNNGAISVSTDQAGGWDSWTNVSTVTGLTTTLSSIQSPEGTLFKAMVAATDGSVYRLDTGAVPVWTAHSGTPWTATAPVSLAFQDDLNGLVVTGAGGVYYSIDGGATWTQTFPHSKGKPRTVWASPTVPGMGYLGCDDGIIMKTISGGQ